MTDYDDYIEQAVLGLHEFIQFDLPEDYETGDSIPVIEISNGEGIFVFQPVLRDERLSVECSAFDCRGQRRQHLFLDAGPC